MLGWGHINSRQNEDQEETHNDARVLTALDGTLSRGDTVIADSDLVVEDDEGNEEDSRGHEEEEESIVEHTDR